jgi:hypothetical protein
MNSMRWTVFVLASCVALTSVSTPAVARFGISIGGADIKGPEDKLRELDKKISEAVRAMPGSFGNDAGKEKAGLDAAEALLKEVGGDIDGGLKKTASNYSQVRGNYDNAMAALADGRLQNACTVARQAVFAFHKAGNIAPEDALAKLDQAVAALAQGGSASAKSGVDWWKKEATSIRENNPKLAEEMKRKADRAEREARAKAIRDARADVTARLKPMLVTAMAKTEAISEESLSGFAESIKKVAAVHPPATALYDKRLRQFRAYNAWFAADAAATAQALAQQLDGTVVASGESDAKTLLASFSAKAGWCYVVPMHWQTWTDGEKADLGKLTSKGKTSQLQRFRVDAWRMAAFDMRGVCTLADMPVQLDGALTFAGTRNGMRWAVIGWEKSKFPGFVATTVDVSGGDRCDTDLWASLWTDPVPGSVVFSGSEAFLVSDTDSEESIWLTATNLNGGNSVRLQKDDITSQPPTARTFKTQMSFGGCPGLDYAEHADSVKLAKCSDTVSKKYGKLFDTWEDKKKYAKSLGSYRAAQKKLDALPGERSKEWERTCGPTEKKVAARWAETFNKLADWYADQAPPVVMDRVQGMMDEYSAFE